MDVGKKRSAIIYSFPKPNVGPIKSLIKLAGPDILAKFRESYGWILSFVDNVIEYEYKGLHTLLQFYDPPLRCFTFPDF